jgi:hypothetical protein
LLVLDHLVPYHVDVLEFEFLITLLVMRIYYVIIHLILQSQVYKRVSMHRFNTNIGAVIFLAVAITVNLLIQQLILPLQVFFGELVSSRQLQEIILPQKVWKPS